MPTISVVAIIKKPPDKILLIKQKQLPLIENWTFPSNKIAKFEDSKVAVTSIVKQITNLDFVNPIFIDKFDEIYQLENFHNISLFYIGEAKGKIRNSTEWFFKWVKIEEAINTPLLFEHNRVLNSYFNTQSVTIDKLKSALSTIHYYSTRLYKKFRVQGKIEECSYVYFIVRECEKANPELVQKTKR